jgi:hypothetical protein
MSFRRQVKHVVTYPNKIPPKATKPEMAMAGHAFPAVSAGLLNKRPITKQEEEWWRVYTRK